MKKDIQNRADIKFLMDTFYKKLMVDEIIGHFFTKVVELSLDKHMPILYNFWDSVLFGAANYKGNPILKHIELDQKERLEKKHFDQWQKVLFETIDEQFEGEKVAEMKNRVDLMGKLMLFKIDKSREAFFVQ